MLVRTDELTDILLDWAVAKANKEYWWNLEPNQFKRLHKDGDLNYSTNPAIAHSIIEREKINLSDWASTWYAKIHRNLSSGSGDTALIAAMRCFVASKLGQMVEVPDELTT